MITGVIYIFISNSMNQGLILHKSVFPIEKVLKISYAS